MGIRYAGGGVFAAEEDVGFRQVGPAAFVVEAGKSADGADDGGGADLYVAPLLDELFDDPAGVLPAEGVEARGASVAIERICICELEIAANVIDAFPLEIDLFDEVDVGAAADLAFAAVTVEAGGGGVAFGDLSLGGAAKRSASWRGRGHAGGGVLGGAAFGLVSGETSRVGLADTPKLIGARGKAFGGEAFIVLSTSVEEDFVEFIGDYHFDRGLVVGHEYLSPLN